MRTIHRDIVGAFIFSSDKKILLGKGSVYKGTLVVPGGGIEEGETKLDAVKRETMEETGLDLAEFDVKQIDLLLTGESHKILRDTGEKVHAKMNFYNFTAASEKPSSEIKTKPGDDLTYLAWYPLKDLHKLNLAPPSVTTLKHLGYL